MTTIVFVPGAWITKVAYEPFLQVLKEAGFDTHFAGYPSLDPKEPSAYDCEADAKAIAETLGPIVEAGKDVLLIMHSYAGMPGAAAAINLSKTQRAKEGKAGGVVGLLFIGAFVVPEGLSCAGLQGGALPPWILLDNPSPGLNIPDEPGTNFAAEVGPELANPFLAEVKPHASLSFTSPQPHPAWADEEYKGRLAFIITTMDKAVPKEAQSLMIESSQKKWITKEIASSHCAPFLDLKEKTLALIRDIISELP